MATHATTGERGMIVAMGHGVYVSFCVCGETTKNKVGPKKSGVACPITITYSVAVFMELQKFTRFYSNPFFLH
jgi:hypothetical protein